MAATPTRLKVFMLMMLWLVTMNVWSPVTTLAHLEMSHPAPGGAMVVQQESAIAESGCPMNDCSMADSKMGHCDISCQPSLSPVVTSVVLAFSGETYSNSPLDRYKAFSPVVFDRPPKLFV